MNEAGGGATHHLPGQPLALVMGAITVWIVVRLTWPIFDVSPTDPSIGVGLPSDSTGWRSPNASRGPERASGMASARDVPAYPIAPNQSPSAPLVAPSGGIGTLAGNAAFDKWLRLAARGGQWRFASSPASGAGWRAGGWLTGYAPASESDRTGGLAKGAGAYAAIPDRMSQTRADTRRWAASAWIMARPGSVAEHSALIPRYGASQLGAVFEYRLGESAATRAYLRASQALVAGGEAEVAVGLKVDIARLPLAVHVERRFAANAAGHDAMATFVSGGFAAGDPAHLAVEGFGQAGVVGFRRRTLFADAAVVARRRIVEIGPVSLSAGVGGWVGAQPGAMRLDIGPRIEARLDDDIHSRLSLDWRERVGGSAKPDSGPAMTLSLSF